MERDKVVIMNTDALIRLAVLEEKSKDVEEIKASIKEVERTVVYLTDKMTDKMVDTTRLVHQIKLDVSEKLADINQQRAKDKGFLAGISFTFSAIGAVLGAVIDYKFRS